MRSSDGIWILIESVQFCASVKEASSNKLSLRMEMGEQHDIRIGVVE
jgi:hypothetical protein